MLPFSFLFFIYEIYTCWKKNRSSRPEVFIGKDVLKICSKCTGEHLCRSAISVMLLCNFTEIELWHGCSAVNLNHIFRTYSYHPLSSHAGMCHGENLDCNMFVLWLYYDCISGDGHQSVNDFHSGWPQAMYHVLTLAQLLQPQDLEGILESNAVTALVAKVGLGKPLGIGVF